MIDFKSLLTTKPEQPIYDLVRFFSALDARGTHTELRPAQLEAMTELTKRYADTDTVLKISTGAGKTTIGLLYLYAHMRMSKEVSVYLCPTVQLMEQVLGEAKKLGIEAHGYWSGETYPNPACTRGDAILVCTYEKLFNAKSTFQRADVNIVPNALVLDDAHAGVESVRSAMTLHLRGSALSDVMRILEPACKQFNPAIWMDLTTNFKAVFEVPHWIWSDSHDAILAALNPRADDDEFRFVWPYLRENLRLCRCILSNEVAEVAPEMPPVQNVRAFAKAKHRLFMSATLADDAVLVRELGVSQPAANSPICPTTDRGLGERMVIAPSLVDHQLDRGFVVRLAAELARTNNVVVLTSSEQQASDWVAVGARYFAGDAFAEGVRLLQDPASGVRFAVFAQRFDGVDLPDDACRVLIIDGQPFGQSLTDTRDDAMTGAACGTRNRTVYRIEQGMGRAVRSHKDYAVVILAGADLSTFMGRQDVQRALTDDSRSQIALSEELARHLKGAGTQPALAVRQLIDQCLNRDEGWKEYYNQKVRAPARLSRAVDASAISLATAEREAYVRASQNQPVEACKAYEAALNSVQLDDEDRGIHQQRLGRLLYQFDRPAAMALQQSAKAKNISLPAPPTHVKRVLTVNALPAAQRVVSWLQQFANLNAAVIEAKRIHDSLDYGVKPKQLEAALLVLGEALGAESSRPDESYRVGPDNLWFWGDDVFVIEAKNGNEDSLHRGDAEQMHHSMQWVEETYPAHSARRRPVVAARVTRVDNGTLYPEGTRVLTQEGCRALAAAFHQLTIKAAQQGPIVVNPQWVHAEMATFGLLPEQFLGKYTSGLN
ncbi:DEAD/DEAH box helicase [Burkholderia vietnamiensis]|uniref:DEAD/DEAH box helicase n=1 Tax=Burkholderia vietnamiensis TaxID=60552 RepID=UPI001592F37E|nr:DEAD/DEAH box helicase [Burkholderia vietnamiensis]MEC4596281.1 DEAD/DEAH box helicase [Burkholderia vietnamiensis]HDR9008679.1 DEAD/DEAH box helicase family protein [Burkholderia vietnamiensis]HDR9013793.1 DEAD/DEAH box helicase family protein [Burkholderia vietnamiensis]